jgi:hypothetical protein
MAPLASAPARSCYWQSESGPEYAGWHVPVLQWSGVEPQKPAADISSVDKRHGSGRTRTCNACIVSELLGAEGTAECMQKRLT